MDLVEEFVMGPADGFPVVDVGDVHAGADHILDPGAGLLQRAADIGQGLHRLGVGVSPADQLAVGTGGRGP